MKRWRAEGRGLGIAALMLGIVLIAVLHRDASSAHDHAMALHEAIENSIQELTALPASSAASPDPARAAIASADARLSEWLLLAEAIDPATAQDSALLGYRRALDALRRPYADAGRGSPDTRLLRALRQQALDQAYRVERLSTHLNTRLAERTRLHAVLAVLGLAALTTLAVLHRGGRAAASPVGDGGEAIDARAPAEVEALGATGLAAYDRGGRCVALFRETPGGEALHRLGHALDETPDPLLRALLHAMQDRAWHEPEAVAWSLLLPGAAGPRAIEFRLAIGARSTRLYWLASDRRAARREAQRQRMLRGLQALRAVVAGLARDGAPDAATPPGLAGRVPAEALACGVARVAGWVDLAPDRPAVLAGVAGEPALLGVCAAALPPGTHGHAMALEQALARGRPQGRCASLQAPDGEALDFVALPLVDAGQPGPAAALLLAGPALDLGDTAAAQALAGLADELRLTRTRLAHQDRRRDALARMRLLAAALEATQDAVMVTDLERHIVSVNRAFTEITGYSEAEARGRTPRLLHSGRHDSRFYARLWKTLKREGRWQGELLNRRKNGELYAQWTSISTVRDDAGRPSHHVAVLTDVTAQKQAAETLHRMTRVDPITGLPNRLAVLDLLEHAVAGTPRSDRRVAVAVFDLDDFKTVNDSLGLAAGDALLAGVAQRLRQALQPEDVLGRLGGDEFIVILERLSDGAEAAAVVQGLLDTLHAPLTVAGQTIYVQASVGISLWPDDAGSAVELVRDADAAMDQAKRAGRGDYRFYTEGLTAAAQNRLALDTRLRRALEQHEFELWYQPLLSLPGRRLIGLEALVRLNQPGLPAVGPAQFIPLLEASGQITALGAWVTGEACRQGRAWLDAGFDFGRIAINLSPVEARHSRIDERVREALRTSGLPAERLELEITETGLMEQGERAEAFLAELHALGVALAIDDFGTGYSSLAYLRRFPVGKLKIDRSFVRDLPGERGDAPLLQTMVTLGHSLGLQVVAEGVETEDQHALLARLGCDAAQGYLYDRPLPADQLVARWLAVRA